MESGRQSAVQARRARALLALRWASPVALVIAWQAAVNYGFVDRHFFPAPDALIAVGWSELVSGALIKNSLGSLERLAGGLLIGAISGIVLGIAMATRPVIDAVLNVPIQVVRAIPPIAWVGFAILWFGLGSRPAIFLIALGVVFPILLNTYAGVRQTDLIYLRAAESLGARGWILFRNVVFAAALPQILTGLRVSVGLAWVLVVVGELVGSPDGLGAALMRAQDYQQTDRMLAYMVAIGIYGYLSDLIVVRISRYLLRWQRSLDA